MTCRARLLSPRHLGGTRPSLLGRPVDTAELGRIVESLAKARDLPEVQAAQAIADTSAAAEHLQYRTAGIDPELADHMYRLLARLSGSGLSIGVVSHIHVDLRPHAEQSGFGQFIEAWALSFQLGVQKPEPEIFQAALGQLGTAPERTLMVGDRASRDGAAAGMGMPCLILPAPLAVTTRGLEAVIALVGAP